MATPFGHTLWPHLFGAPQFYMLTCARIHFRSKSSAALILIITMSTSCTIATIDVCTYILTNQANDQTNAQNIRLRQFSLPHLGSIQSVRSTKMMHHDTVTLSSRFWRGSCVTHPQSTNKSTLLCQFHTAQHAQTTTHVAQTTPSSPRELHK